jgi:hypothetical protein
MSEIKDARFVSADEIARRITRAVESKEGALRDLIFEIVRLERERCALVAEGWGCESDGLEIAAAIRAGPTR